jgi:DNA-binding MarR family transcriptional regulator
MMTATSKHSIPLKRKLSAAPQTFYKASTYVPDASVGYLMRRVMLSIAQEVEHALAPTGLTNAQWVPLYKIATGCALTAAELARECQLDTGAMTRMLNRLQAKGLCKRVPSEDDRRVVNLKMTAAGRKAVQGIPAVLSQVQNEHLVGFTQAEWQTLQSLLARMLLNAQNIQASYENEDD